MLREVSQERKSSDGDQSGTFSCSSFSLDSSRLGMGSVQHDAGKSLYLEQQIISLTRDKKQLMTHLHWLSRQRAEQSRHDDIGKNVKKEAESVSLEEGIGAKFEPFLARFSRSSECLWPEKTCEVVDDAADVQATCIVQNAQDVSENEECIMGMVRDQKLERQLTEKNLTDEQCKEKHLITKLKRLKATMLAVKEIVVKNNETCNSIFQLSFQNIKHPNEPRCYSMWSSCDEEHISSLVRSQESLNCLINSGYRSLDYCPELQNSEVNFPYECHGILKKKTSPELFIRGKDGLNQHSASLSSFELANRDKPPLSRSLSSQETKFLPSEGGFFESLPLAKGSQKSHLPTFATKSDLHSFNCDTRITDYEITPLHFSVVEHATRRQEHSGSQDNSQLSSCAPSPSSTHFPENLIS